MNVEKNIKLRDQENALEIYGYKINFFNDQEFKIDDLRVEDIEILGDKLVNNYSIKFCFDKIYLFNCEISFDENINYGKEIFFNNCKFLNNIKINHITYEFNKEIIENISFYNSYELSFINVDLIIGNYGIKHIKNEKISLNHASSNVNAVSGKIDSIFISSQTFNLKSGHGVFIKNFYSSGASFRFNDGNIEIIRKGDVQFYGLELDNKSIFEREGGYPFKLRIESIKFKKLLIDNLNLNLTTKDIVLDESMIYFENNSSLDIGRLDSVATVWNPSNIKYRGFCPSEGVEGIIEFLQYSNILASQEFFGEMKEYFSKRGNGITASSFYAAEMKAHRAYLIKKGWTNNCGDRLSASWSFYSSDFNQNWLLALGWYFLISFIFLIFFVLPDFIANDSFKNFNLKNVLNSLPLYVNYYADILSPLTISFKEFKDDSLNLVSIPDWLIFFWMFWKIIAGYLIYQIVVSSRRFVRFK